jgi:hypothetical protein
MIINQNTTAKQKSSGTNQGPKRSSDPKITELNGKIKALRFEQKGLNVDSAEYKQLQGKIDGFLVEKKVIQNPTQPCSSKDADPTRGG